MFDKEKIEQYYLVKSGNTLTLEIRPEETGLEPIFTWVNDVKSVNYDNKTMYQNWLGRTALGFCDVSYEEYVAEELIKVREIDEN